MNVTTKDSTIKMYKELILKNRSYRRFDESFEIAASELRELVNFARLSPSAANLQPLKYMICNETKMNGKIFHTLNWAAYLKEWKGPEVGERPSAYIMMLRDKNIKQLLHFDQGIAAQSIMLGAVSKNLGGCMIASFKEKKLSDILKVPEYLEVTLVLAIGKPIEKIQLETLKNDDVKYWRDENAVHHVPKRELKDILIHTTNCE